MEVAHMAQETRNCGDDVVILGWLHPFKPPTVLRYVTPIRNSVQRIVGRIEEGQQCTLCEIIEIPKLPTKASIDTVDFTCMPVEPSILSHRRNNPVGA